MDILSYGGGVQTAALLVLMNKDPFIQYAVFADTGSELDMTYKHIEIMKEYSKIPLITVRSDKGKLHEWQGETMLPMYFEEGGFNRRQCTNHWKIIPIRRWLRKQGAREAGVQIGISIDEAHRAKDANVKWITHKWPLIEMGLTRQDCINILEEEGLPIPPKSSCFMCPYRRISEWTKLRAEQPQEFDRAVEYEKAHPGLFLSYKAKPLDKIVGMQETMFESAECGGYCMV
jgi:hypothetical protein